MGTREETMHLNFRLKEIACACLMISLTGCGIGLNSVLFVTKTAIAVDADTEPPSADIGYAREEFVLAPAFKNGEVLPVLTTIGARPGVLEFGSNHSFATGDAALVMADALTSKDDYPFAQNAADPTKVQRPTLSSTIETGKKDTVPHGFWESLWFFVAGNSERQRYFFGTDTNFGLHVEWGGSELPRSVALGFKRKELSYVPLVETEASDKRTVSLASLIATANFASDVKSPQEAGLEIGQTFATGAAATLLAGHPEVREVLGPSLVKDYQKIRTLKFEKDAKDLSIREPLVDWIKSKFEGETDAAKKQAILKKSVELTLVSADTNVDTFTRRLHHNLTTPSSPNTNEHLAKLKEFMMAQFGYPD
ncbi:MAG: hypothetical protein OJF52_001852 [Nitrospira sp.]|nr:MAG: hypothetical protein OJF52_001852 [Nitrospira sp.]